MALPPKSPEDEHARLDSLEGRSPPREEMENYLIVLEGSSQAASAVLEGLELDPNDAGCMAILAAVSARFLALYPGKAVVDMDEAWTPRAEKFMFTQCKKFNGGLHLTKEDPRSSLEKLTLKLCFETFETNTLDGDAVTEIEFAIQTLQEQTGEKYDKELNQLREKLQKEKDRFCFVATVVYGSADAAELDILRKFRDSFLLRFRLGRFFVQRYYEVGPSIASFVAKRKILRKVVRAIFDFGLFLLTKTSSYRRIDEA
jgi:hypothetical protein